MPDAAGLAARRSALGLTQADVAAALGAHPRKVGRLEQGRAFDIALLQVYERLVAKLESEYAKKGC